MPDERSDWLALIRAQPDDDAPRLAFADWLDEHGEPDFARFIRLEIELDPLPQKDPRRVALQKQALRLRIEKKLPWNASGTVATRRGFINKISNVSVYDILSMIPDIRPYANQMTVDLVTNFGYVTNQDTEKDTKSVFCELFGNNWVRDWSHLNCHLTPLNEQQWRWMIEPGHLINLESLSLEDGADTEVIRAVCHSFLPKLKALHISDVFLQSGENESHLTPEIVRFLVNSPLLQQLESLSLWGRWLGDDELRQLANTPKLSSLKSLYLWPQLKPDSGLRALLQSPHLFKLRRLNLSRISINQQTATLLARPDLLPGLRELEICFEDLIYRELLLPRFGDGLLLGPTDEYTSGEPGEECQISHIRLPYYYCFVVMPGPFTRQQSYGELNDDVTKAISAAPLAMTVEPLKRNPGRRLSSSTYKRDQGDYGWYWSFCIYDIQEAVIHLREALGKLNIQPDTRIEVRGPRHGSTARTYPLTPSSTDWDDLAEVERSTRVPDAMWS